MKKNKYSLFIIGFITFYFLFGMISGFLGVKEIFPFFSWSLFSDIPNKRYEYTVVVNTYNGKKILPPKFFQELKEIPGHESSTPRRIIQNLGMAYENMKIIDGERLRKVFEANYIDVPAKYRLVKLIYDPIERWREDKYIMINIQEFEVN